MDGFKCDVNTEWKLLRKQKNIALAKKYPQVEKYTLAHPCA